MAKSAVPIDDQKVIALPLNFWLCRHVDLSMLHH